MQLESMSSAELTRLLGAEPSRLSGCFGPPAGPSGTYLETEVLTGRVVRRLVAQELLSRIGPEAFLNERRVLVAVDRGGMAGRIRNLTRYMRAGKKAVQTALRGAAAGKFERMRGCERVVVAGLGGSAIGPTLAVEVLNNMGYFVPVEICRDYPLRYHQLGPEVLVIISSFSGNTEEALFTYEEAARNGCPVLCVATGGLLEKCAKDQDDPFVEIPVKDGFEGGDVIVQPRESIGFSTMTFLSLFARLGVARSRELGTFGLPDLKIWPACGFLDSLDAKWGPRQPLRCNEAKKAALHSLYGVRSARAFDRTRAIDTKTPVFFVDKANESLGRRIENQFGECVESPVKVLTFFEDAHNEIEQVATCTLEAKLLGEEDRFSYLAIRSADESGRAALRFDRTLWELFGAHGIPAFEIRAKGRSPFERKLYLLKFLDYLRAYASVLRGTEPLSVPFMDRMKNVMHAHPTDADRSLLPQLKGRRRTLAGLVADQALKQEYPLIRVNLHRLEMAGLIEYSAKGTIRVK